MRKKVTALSISYVMSDASRDYGYDAYSQTLISTIQRVIEFSTDKIQPINTFLNIKSGKMSGKLHFIIG